MKFGLVFYSRNQVSRTMARDILLWLNQKQIPFALEKDSQIEGFEASSHMPIEQLAKNCQFLLVIGGDGSILRASRHCARHNCILVGIHGGTKGFLTQIDQHNLFQGLERLLDGKFTIQKRQMLQASILRKGQKVASYYGLNEAVLKVSSLSRIVNFQLYADNLFVEEYPGDGLLISTPTGSTGYSLSAGGPLVSPDFELLLMTPICVHKFKSRPWVFQSSTELRIEPRQTHDYVKSKVILTIDGQVGYHLQDEDEVLIKTAPNKIQLAIVYEQDYFEVLRQKID